MSTSPDLDTLAGIVTDGICQEAFGLLGITPAALDLAAEAVLATRAIAGEPGEFPRAGGIPVPVPGPARGCGRHPAGECTSEFPYAGGKGD